MTRLGVRHGTPFTGAITSTSIICAFFAALLLIGGVTPGPLWPAVGWFTLTGVAATAPARILFYSSMRRIGVSRATILILISPLLSLLYAVLLLGERPSWAVIVGAFVVVGGVASVVTDRSGIRMSPRSIGLGILPTLFMGFTLIFIRLGMQALPDAVLGSGVSSFSALLTLLALQKFISPEERWGAEWKGMNFFLIGGVCYCGAFYTYPQGLGVCGGQLRGPSRILVAAFFYRPLPAVSPISRTGHMAAGHRGGHRVCRDLSRLRFRRGLIPPAYRA